MQTNLLVAIFHHISLAVGIHFLKSRFLQGVHDNALFALRTRLSIQGVDVHTRLRNGEGCFLLLCLIDFLLFLQILLHAVVESRQGEGIEVGEALLVRHAQRVSLHVVVELNAEAVVVAFHRVDVVRQLCHRLGAGTSRHVLLICEVEVCVEVDDEVLLHKCLPSVGHIPRLQRIAGEVLELFPLIEVQQQVQFVAGGFQSGRICQDDVCPVHPVLHVVDDDIVEHTRLLILVLHVEVDVLNPIVEHTFGDIQLW